MIRRTLAAFACVSCAVLAFASCGDSSGGGAQAAAGAAGQANPDASPDGANPDGSLPGDAQSDAPACGDHVVDPGETCDGDCPTSCDDADGCTQDVMTGSAAACSVVCTNTVTITTCTSGDGCCPAACNRDTDNDCPYYVDATGGNDANDGLTPQTAWKTLAKVSSTTFQPGDNIAFKRGETWHEALTVKSQHGQLGKPIVFRTYGESSARPVFAPTRVVTQWTKGQDEIWVADLPVKTNQVFVDGVRLPIAHHPNTGYLYVDTEEDASNKTSFDDAELTATEDQLVGADIAVRSVRWAYDENTIVDKVGARLTITPGIEAAGVFHKNTGYLLANKLWMLDSPGEWFWDAEAKKLYVRLTGDSDPTTHVVEASEGEAGILAQDDTFVVIHGLEVRYASRYGIRLAWSPDCQIQSCLVQGAGATGIIVDWPPDGATDDVLDNIVRDSAYNGITVSADPAQTQHVTVQRNQVYDTMASYPSVGRTESSPSGNAIALFGRGTTFQENVIQSTAYDCMIVGGSSHVVERNWIQRCCLLLDDCGGIYMGGDSHVVRANILKDMIGNAEGVPAWFDDKSTAAQGIYPDDRSHDVLIDGNTVINADLGIQVHNSYANQIMGNTVFASRESAIWFSEDTIVNIPGYVHDNNTHDNIFFPGGDTIALGEGGWLGEIEFGTFDHNAYWHSKGTLPIRQSLEVNGQYEGHEYSLQQWRDATGNDLSSKDIADTYRIEPVTGTPTSAGEIIANGTFDSATTGWSSWPAEVTIAWAADCGLTGGCMRFSANPPASGALVSSNAFEVKQGTGYQLRFSVTANASDTLQAVVLRNSDPWDDTGLSVSVPVSATRSDYVFVFTATKAATAAVYFFFSNKATQFAVDDVSLREVTVSKNDPADDARIETNPSAADKTIDLGAEQVCDVDGNVLTGTFVLAPYSSKILLSCFCNNDHQCNNKETKATCPGDCP